MLLKKNYNSRMLSDTCPVTFLEANLQPNLMKIFVYNKIKPSFLRQCNPTNPF
jgi:hypothetical protein